MPRIVLTVTNDLHYDRRMQRIAGALVEAGYEVVLVGRVLSHSPPLQPASFEQVRLRCRYNKGFVFYAEYNLRLFFWLLRARYDAVCSADLDTLAAGCFASLLRRKKRVYDAHEYFTEVPEVVDRPFVKAFWAMIARICLPFYRHAYTVGPALATIFKEQYGLPLAVIRNVPLLASELPPVEKKEKIILYQGALNEGRGIETALEAMQYLEGVQLWLAGEGDLSDKLRAYAQELGLGGKVRFLGFISPSELDKITAQAWLGLNLFENRGLNYYYSLANKFFSYVQLGVPSLNMDFPEYRAHCDEYRVGLLLPELSPAAVVRAVKELENDPELYQTLQDNCRKAARVWNWEVEKTALLKVWEEVFRT
jgi:glycosyltransferase involved in cell wall biosynthesis